MRREEDPILRPGKKLYRDLRPYRKPTPQKRRDYWYAAFALSYALTGDKIQYAVNGFSNGILNPNQFGAAALAILHDSHSTAYVCGAQSVGVDVVPAEVKPYIDSVMETQAEFLGNFLDQIESGDPRYVKSLEELYPEGLDGSPPPAEIADGYLDDHAIQERMKLYVERTRGTGNWGAIDMLAPWEEIHWILGPNENHCQDCPERASRTWRKNTLPGVPGDGSTECLVRCHCRLELSDGTIIDF